MGVIQQGLPSKQHVLRLLNDAFDGWGTEAYFEWRYDAYPEYDPEMHNFFKREDGELIAFRRLYERHIHISNQEDPVKTFMLGDTVVHKDHRGEGHYSELHARTTQYCDERDTDLLLTYNSKDNTTFAANRNRGWKYRDMPLYIHILSPAKVINQYADQFVTFPEILENVVGLVGDRITLHTSGETVRVSELLQKDQGSTEPRAIPVFLSDTAVTSIVRSVSNDRKRDLVSTALKLLINKDITLATSRNLAVRATGNPSFKSTDLETELKTELSTAEIDAIQSLYEQRQKELVAWFRREPIDIKHMIDYPGADVVLCRDDDEIMGFAVIAPKQNENIVEARILDMVYRQAEDFENLLSEVIQVASNKGYDLLIASLEREPENGWIPIDKQALMWRSLTPESDYAVLHRDDVKVSLYDV